MKLSEFESQVMQIFWQKPQASAPEVHALISKNKDVTYSTVKTIIDRLEQKQAIKRSSLQGRTIFYKAAVSAKKLRKPMLKNFIDKVFAGDKKQLINHLFDEQQLSQDDITYLEALIKSNKEKT